MATRELKVRLNADATQFNRGMGAALSRVKNFKGAIAGATAALAAYAGAQGIAAATRASIQFEEKTAELQKLLGDIGGEAAAKEIQSLSNELPVARDRLLDVGAAAARLGIRGTENISNFTEVMAEVGAATDLSADVAAESMARLAKITQTPINQVRNLASAVNAASNTMAASFSDVLDAALRAAPGLSAVGATQPEVVALAGSLAQVSANASRAGTRLNRLGSALANPKKFEDFAAALGVTVQQFRRMMAESPAQVILQLAGVMAEGGAAADQLSGSLQETSLKVLRGLAQNLGETEEAVANLNEEFEKGASIGEEAQRFFGITASKLEVLDNQFSNVATTAGGPFREALNQATTAVIEFGNTDNQVRKIGQTFALIGEQIVFVTRVVGNLVEIVANSLTGAANLAFSAIGRIVNDTLLRPINKVMELLGRDFRFALVDVEAAFEAFQGDTRDIEADVQDIVDAGGNLLSAFDEVLNPAAQIQDATDRAADNTKEMADNAGQAANNMERAAQAATGFQGFGDFRAEPAVRRATEAESALARAVTPGSGVKEKAEQAGGDVGQSVTQGMDRVLERGAQRAMDSLLSGLIRGRDNILSSVIDIGLSIASAIATNGMMDFLQIGSPSRLAVRIGEQVGEGLIVGMQNMMGAVEGQSMAMAGAAAPSLPAGPAASGGGFGSSRQVVIHEGDRNVQIQAMDSESFRQFADRNRGIFGGAVARASRESQGIRHQILTGR